MFGKQQITVFNNVKLSFLLSVSTSGHPGFHPYLAWPPMLKTCMFFRSISSHNNTFRTVVICNRLLAYITVFCYVMLCYVMLCYVMLCYVMLCYVMLCYATLCYVMLCYVMLCYNTLQ